ncbi:MAG: FHA domain-containing protein [Pseudomonadota bacterium]
MASSRQCCIRSAMELPDATFCIECSQPLLRCMAFAECGGVVSESGHCPICVKPQLQIKEGAVLHGSVGGAVAVPFELVNGSLVDRRLYVRGLWSREGNGDWREERLGWSELEPGGRKSASVTAREIDKPGQHEIHIMWSVATVSQTREERFAYAASVRLSVPDPRNQAQSNIQINGENQKGNVIEVNVGTGAGGADAKTIKAIDMQVDRQDVEERKLGLRGMGTELFVSRGAKFEIKGFAPGHAPDAVQPIVTPNAMLVFGRHYSRQEGGTSDVRLLVMDADGTTDETGSTVISRRHFELYVENDRLVLHVAGANGLRVNETAHSVDELVTLKEGDVIAPIQDRPDALAIRIAMRRERNKINRVILSRQPVISGQTS